MRRRIRKTRDGVPSTAGPLFALLLLLLPVTSQAGSGSLRWLVGLDGLHERIDDRSDTVVAVDDGQDSGALQVGLRVGPSLLVRLYSSGADHRTNAGDADLRLEFAVVEAVVLLRDGQRLRPYLCGGVGGGRASSRRDVLEYEATGPAVSAGAGAFWDFARRWAVHGAVRIVAVNWEQERAVVHLPDGTDLVSESPLDTSGVTAQTSLGIVFRF